MKKIRRIEIKVHLDRAIRNLQTVGSIVIVIKSIAAKAISAETP
jgi:hypothetical protein